VRPDDPENPYSAPEAPVPARPRERSRLARIAWLLPALAASGFVGYFIVPKVEVYWKQEGITPPLWGRAMIALTHFTFDYFFMTLPLLAALVVWALWRPGSRGDRA
jgi:hypothetical protein